MLAGMIGPASGGRRHARMWAGEAYRMMVGAALGGLAAFVVACALVEITLSPLFASAFGALFILSGTMMGYQARPFFESASADSEIRSLS